tara:strand:+ start:482 stop:589 length:108 start_codon:yes stop_codon:yes gene_type:complete
MQLFPPMINTLYLEKEIDTKLKLKYDVVRREEIRY